MSKVRVFYKNGTHTDMPRTNLERHLVMMEDQVLRIEDADDPQAPIVAPPAAPEPEEPKEPPTKAELLGDLLDDGKINADELADWIADCDDIDHIAIVIKGDKRKTVTAAADKRVAELNSN